MPTQSGHTTAIRAKTVIGSKVRDTQGDTIGKVEDIVLDKTNNSIMFAVVGFGGVLGVGEKFHPIPWSALDYNPSEEAYVVNYSKDQLTAAPAATIDELVRDDGGYPSRAYDHYGTERDWR